MTRELLLLRHAKSDRPVGVDDFSRPLKKRGRRAAKRIGAWLREQQLVPDTILSSPAVRALATAQRVCKQLAIDESAIVRDERIYEAEASTLLDILKTCPHEAQRVLLVGHNPGLEGLLLDLAAHSISLTSNGKLLPTAALARLTFEGDWTDLREGCATLVTLLRRDSLPE